MATAVLQHAHAHRSSSARSPRAAASPAAVRPSSPSCSALNGRPCCSAAGPLGGGCAPVAMPTRPEGPSRSANASSRVELASSLRGACCT
eukprot:352852-Chlamydomonas_euryale.AAC.6